MPFKRIMTDLVEKTPGAKGAIFVDWEGEAVDHYTSEDEAYDLKVVGAHKGVILNLIKGAQRAADEGEIKSVSIMMENYSVMMAPVNYEYFVVLTLEPGAAIGKARFAIVKAAEAIRDEI